MALDDDYDWSRDQDEEDYDDDDEEYQQHHKDNEAYLYDQGQYYSQRVDAGADYDERERRLNGMMGDVDDVIAARRAENDELGDTYGGYDAHEERIRVLEADHDALRLERLHAAEEAAGRPNSAWNEETGEWGEIQEADYEAEEGQEGEEEEGEEEEEDDSDSGSGSDMDLESDIDSESDEERVAQRPIEEAHGNDEEEDMDIESDSDDD